MKNTLAEVDEYINNAPEFAKPILKRLQKLFHQASPQISETIKWRYPHFEYLGIVGMMAAFKNHVTVGFRKGKLMKDSHGLLSDGTGPTPFGFKIKTIADLPDDEILLEYIREAIDLNQDGVKLPKPAIKKAAKQVPEDLRAALASNPKARETFENFAPGYQRDYIEWLLEAKQDATRQKRLATTIEWLSEGKSRNWKYEKK